MGKISFTATEAKTSKGGVRPQSGNVAYQVAGAFLVLDYTSLAEVHMLQSGNQYKTSETFASLQDSADGVIQITITEYDNPLTGNFQFASNKSALLSIGENAVVYGDGSGSVIELPDSDVRIKVIEAPDVVGAGLGGLPLSPTKTETSTTYTVDNGDQNAVIALSNASTITVSFASDLPDGFSCVLVKAGAGDLNLTAADQSAGNTLATQYTAASIVKIGSEVYAFGTLT